MSVRGYYLLERLAEGDRFSYQLFYTAAEMRDLIYNTICISSGFKFESLYVYLLYLWLWWFANNSHKIAQLAHNPKEILIPKQVRLILLTFQSTKENINFFVSIFAPTYRVWYLLCIAEVTHNSRQHFKYLQGITEHQWFIGLSFIFNREKTHMVVEYSFCI